MILLDAEPAIKRTDAGRGFRRLLMAIAGVTIAGCLAQPAWPQDALNPLVAKGQPADWWFVFKFNSKFPGCGEDSGKRACPFGGKVQAYKAFSQQFVSASSSDGKLAKGRGCVGVTQSDPLGATFDQVYNGKAFFVIWNDQFYQDPRLKACGKADSCDAPWGHSKGMLAWNDAGEGFVLQVTTPSWPGAGSKRVPRKDGNTLGCVTNNNVLFAQHFFALKLNKQDVVTVLRALINASIVTDPGNSQIVRNGGPSDIQDLVDTLGKKSDSKIVLKNELSKGVILISKPSKLNVPPWQMVSAMLSSESNKAATWWNRPKIFSTLKSTKMKCWDTSLRPPGAVSIVTTGQWKGKEFKLVSGANHAKIGVTTSGDDKFAIFGDMNQQGTIAPPRCEQSQNGRGGLFFVVKNKDLFDTMTDLLDGDIAPTSGRP